VTYLRILETGIESHQHSYGAKKSSDTSIGKSVAGNTSKIHMVTDSHGNPVNFEITGGNVHDTRWPVSSSREYLRALIQL
jgi:hypothetical protein